MAQDPLDAEIAAFENLRPTLEARHPGRWVVVTDGSVWKVFDTFHEGCGSFASAVQRGPGGAASGMARAT